MKIEIELTNSYEADITVDGKKFKYGFVGQKGYWDFYDIVSEELTNTIGGLVIKKICEDMDKILQNWIPEEESPDDDLWETWEILPDHIANDMDWKMF